ncbi:hypothetical protein [Kitasatospora sp. A2-31]|uniref:hypothetical protein n=1 Tax=Kitasatospora sp. A2-31 TaxID=2916414 RepID=UPI001EEB6506|nr:hypothetical protein [Kitasatospora sp. A2-31]MCG6494779.1 hypothetical protein [Kitasatospora sp. A2-31]
MSHTTHTRTRRTRNRSLALAAGAAVLALTLTACGSDAMGGMDHGAAGATATATATGATGTGAGTPAGGHQGHRMPGADSATATTAAPGTADPAADAPGLAAERNGYRLTPATDSLPAGAPTEFRFTVTGPDGKPLTAFEPDQTKRMHFYAIRSDLTGFQHVHPEMAADGTWTAPLAALTAGSWRLYASFVPDSGPGRGTGLVLSRTVTVPGEGAAAVAELPAATGTATVDGYTVSVEGTPVAGKAGELKVTVSKDGKPVTDLQPYLETFAHLTAFRAGDQAFAHLHPEARAAAGATGGPTLPFHAELPASGAWRLFLQFQTGGQLHTAGLTLDVG